MAMGLARRLETVGVCLLLFYGLTEGAQAADRAPANVILDFIVGGKHAPWYVALEKGFYAKRGLAVAIQPSAGSADALRTIGSGGGDFGTVDLPTMIVAKSRGMPVIAAAQLGYVGATILWRDEGVIKTIKDLEGKSLAT
jgi:NitT/TauT family transport system substrate-binding protein